MAKIKIKITKDGKTQIKVEGVQGSGCNALTKPLEEALGKTVSDQKTQDYYKQNNSNQQNLHN